MTRGWTSLSIGIPKNESELQQIAVMWFRQQYPEHALRLYAIPNGGQRSITTATRLKREGVISGVWDLFLSIPKSDNAGLYIEAKFGKNGLTYNQKAFREVNHQEYAFKIFYTLEEFKTIISEYFTRQ